jgi:SHS2 domain-containing protein
VSTPTPLPRAARYDYFEHAADIGVLGRGDTVELAFESAAAAMFAIMAEPSTVGHDETVDVTFTEPDLELALPQWLNALLAAARERGLVLAHFHLERSGDEWRGHAEGERWSTHHEWGTEVKGATLTNLLVCQTTTGWEARCVVDV